MVSLGKGECLVQDAGLTKNPQWRADLDIFLCLCPMEQRKGRVIADDRPGQRSAQAVRGSIPEKTAHFHPPTGSTEHGTWKAGSQRSIRAFVSVSWSCNIIA